MNGLDVFLIICILIVVIGGLTLFKLSIKYDGIDDTTIIIFVLTIGAAVVLCAPFIVIDKGSGSTIGEVTSVDKNFFGTTAVYIKTSETAQERYCVEDSKVAEQAKELIGKKVKISYDERVGIYSTSKCGEAPIDHIEEVKEGSGN